MPIARCPVCEDILSLGSDLALSQPVTCSTCLSNLKVVSLEPCELEEANRRPPRSYQGGRPYPQGGQRGPQGGHPGGRNPSSGPVNNRPGASAPSDRRLQDPRPMPVFPPNPEKQVDNRRAQKWEKPKDEEPEREDDGFEEFEDKLNRNRGKGKRNK